MSDSGRERKVRGRQIRSDREQKQTRKESKIVEGDDPPGEISDVSDAVGPFVETDEVARLRERIERWLSADRPVHVVGPTGSGKTALALEVARRRDRPTVWINGDEDLDTADLVGEHAGTESYTERDAFVRDVVKKKEVVRDRWVDNPLTIAVKEGGTLVYNEFSRSKATANNVLLSVLEEGVLELPGQRGGDRRIEVHPEFRVILTSNSVEYAGVHQPQDALLDRLVAVHLGGYGFETEVEIVAAHSDLDRDQIEEIVETMHRLREELDVLISTRAAITVAEGVAVFPDDEPLADIVADVLASKVADQSDAEDLRGRINDVLGG